MNSAALGGYLAVRELGPVVGGLVIGGTLYGGYRVVRWVAGEWAYFAVKRRQIKGGQQTWGDEPAGPTIDDIIASAPKDTVDYPDED